MRLEDKAWIPLTAGILAAAIVMSLPQSGAMAEASGSPITTVQTSAEPDSQNASLASSPDRTGLRLKRAELLLTGGELAAALRDVDDVLRVEPDNGGARRLRTHILAKLGALSLALECATNAVAGSGEQTVLLGEQAGQRIRWGEPEAATNILSSILAGERSQFEMANEWGDMVLALAAMRQFSCVTNIYRAWESSGRPIPYWVHDAAASSLLELRLPELAHAAYLKALKGRPDRFESRMGLYHALVDMDRFEEAGRILDMLEKETPEWIWEGGNLRFNWNREELAVERGWWFAYQNRLVEARRHLLLLHALAPANLAVRTALAQIDAWRGLPLHAMEEFDVVLGMSPEDVLKRPTYVPLKNISGRIGRAGAMNDAGFKQEAREELAVLYAANPWNNHLLSLMKRLETEDSPFVETWASVSEEHPGVIERDATVKLGYPVNLKWELSAYGRRLETEKGVSNRRDRVGAGISWMAAPWARFDIEVSKNAVRAGGEGIATKFEWKAGDTWNGDVYHDTYSLQVPLRARAQGVEGSLSGTSIRWRPDDVFSAGVGMSLHDLDDGNRSLLWLARAERLIASRGLWSLRGLGEISMGRNSKTDVPYFSPDHASSALLGLRLDQILFRRYERVFSHRLTAEGGFYDQALYDAGPIWDVSYEQEFVPSTGVMAVWGIQYRRRIYDGEDTDVVSADAGFRFAF